jgi:transposase InsO family protein
LRIGRRDFSAQLKDDGPNKLWVADITYLPTWAGFLYLAPSSLLTTSRPSTSRRPSLFTPATTRHATLTMRPSSRHFTSIASSQT